MKRNIEALPSNPKQKIETTDSIWQHVMTRQTYSECVMQESKIWCLIGIHISCHNLMPQAMHPCKINILILHPRHSNSAFKVLPSFHNAWYIHTPKQYGKRSKRNIFNCLTLETFLPHSGSGIHWVGLSQIPAIQHLVQKWRAHKLHTPIRLAIWA